ncbi:hypothetical protein RFI_05342, partial [Reticulomyxa filosa]
MGTITQHDNSNEAKGSMTSKTPRRKRGRMEVGEVTDKKGASCESAYEGKEKEAVMTKRPDQSKNAEDAANVSSAKGIEARTYVSKKSKRHEPTGCESNTQMLNRYYDTRQSILWRYYRQPSKQIFYDMFQFEKKEDVIMHNRHSNNDNNNNNNNNAMNTICNSFLQRPAQIQWPTRLDDSLELPLAHVAIFNKACTNVTYIRRGGKSTSVG